MSMKFVTAAAILSAAAVSTPALADKGDTFVRVRAIMVAPNEKSGGILPALPTEKVKISNSVMPEVDVTHMLSDNIGLELIAATTKHHASGRTGVTGGIGKLASTWVLPPTLTLQYHLAPKAKVRPYVGVGVNYTLFYSEKASNAFEVAAGQTKVKMKASAGFAGQAGIDFDLNDRTFVNFDVKYIDISTTARLATTALGTQRVKIKLNPWVVGVGIGFRL